MAARQKFKSLIDNVILRLVAYYVAKDPENIARLRQADLDMKSGRTYPLEDVLDEMRGESLEAPIDLSALSAAMELIEELKDTSLDDKQASYARRIYRYLRQQKRPVNYLDLAQGLVDELQATELDETQHSLLRRASRYINDAENPAQESVVMTQAELAKIRQTLQEMRNAGNATAYDIEVWVGRIELSLTLVNT
jgi:hypothetical protein